MKSIWCLFSIVNDYNQPPTNLVAAWCSKPTFKDIKNIFKKLEIMYIPESPDNFNPEYGKLSRGDIVQYYDTEYRIEEFKLEKNYD